MPPRATDRILLIDPAELRREMLARRLEAQGYTVEQACSGAEGAELALSNPPAAVVSDLWMPSVSGVQVCRLLRAEPATASVPVILCVETDDPRHRFWADRAGAVACLVKGRTAELVRALSRALSSRAPPDEFFVQLAGGSVDIRDRISRHLDAALFDSVIAGEIRSLGSAGSFERLFDSLAQLLSQVVRYRWIALAAPSPGGPGRVAIHHHPTAGRVAEDEARGAFGLGADVPMAHIEDEDAVNGTAARSATVQPVVFGGVVVGRFAMSVSEDRDGEALSVCEIVARELGGALKMTALIEESQRLAAIDPLTNLMNRRAFITALRGEIARCRRHGHSLTLALLDVDHFKQINDSRGHAGGDKVLASIGGLLQAIVRTSDYVARWGGEEFVLAYTCTGAGGGTVAAERLRTAIEAMLVTDEDGHRIPVTASIGLAELAPADGPDELVDRADRAMYESKATGRNRITVAGPDKDAAPVSRVA